MIAPDCGCYSALIDPYRPPRLATRTQSAEALRNQRLNACGSSQLDPRELVDGFDGLAVACSDGDRDKRIILGGPRQRTANPRCAAVGIDRAAPSNRRARAQPNSSPVLSPLGSTVLDFVLALVAAMARQPDHLPARDSLALAP